MLIFYAIVTGARFSELRPIYQGCRALTSALARLSCWPYGRTVEAALVDCGTLGIALLNLSWDGRCRLMRAGVGSINAVAVIF